MSSGSPSNFPVFMPAPRCQVPGQAWAGGADFKPDMGTRPSATAVGAGAGAAAALPAPGSPLLPPAAREPITQIPRPPAHPHPAATAPGAPRSLGPARSPARKCAPRFRAAQSAPRTSTPAARRRPQALPAGRPAPDPSHSVHCDRRPCVPQRHPAIATRPTQGRPPEATVARVSPAAPGQMPRCLPVFAHPSWATTWTLCDSLPTTKPRNFSYQST